MSFDWREFAEETDYFSLQRRLNRNHHLTDHATRSLIIFERRTNTGVKGYFEVTMGKTNAEGEMACFDGKRAREGKALL